MGKASRQKWERKILTASALAHKVAHPTRESLIVDWNSGLSVFGLGLTIFAWVAPMIWATFPRTVIVTLFILGAGLMLFWPISSGIGLIRRHLEPPYGLISMIIAGGLIGGALFGSAYYLTEPETPTVPKVATQENKNNPIIEISYDMQLIGLPIPMEPFTTMPIIAVKPIRKVELEYVTNNRDKRFLWPTNENITPPEAVGKVFLSNYGDSGVFNVSYSITLAIGAQKDPGGVTEIPLKLPLHNLPLGKTAVFHIVNQSSFPVLIRFSKEADIQAQGETARRRVAVHSRDMTFFDRLPMLQPSWHEWSGSKLLEPDKWKKNNRQEKK